MTRVTLLCLMTLCLSACATAGLETREVLNSPSAALPRSATVASVPFIVQTEYFCGPATLAMVMGWAGRKVTPEELGSQVFTKSGKGSLQADLISASRRNGMVAVKLNGLITVLKEVAAGHPVIVLQNLGFSWLPQWHYSVITGYDLNSQEVVMHSGKSENVRQSLNHFERGFKLAGYWGLVVLPANQLSANGSVFDHLRAAAGLEQAGRLEEAERSYYVIQEKWPDQLATFIGLGNVAYQNKDFKRSVTYLKKASGLFPTSLQAKHNLEVAEKALRAEVSHHSRTR